MHSYFTENTGWNAEKVRSELSPLPAGYTIEDDDQINFILVRGAEFGFAITPSDVKDGKHTGQPLREWFDDLVKTDSHIREMRSSGSHCDCEHCRVIPDGMSWSDIKSVIVAP